MSERHYQGTAIAPGFEKGPLVRIDQIRAVASEEKAAPSREKEKLERAIGQASLALQALKDEQDETGALILEFQVEMLQDPALIEEALDDIAGGESASLAWERALDGQIEGFEAAEDDYFRARASDLQDLKERVLRALAGESDSAELVDGAILLARDLTPSRFLELDWSRLGGVALEEGSATSHVAILARARGVAMVVGTGVVTLEDEAPPPLGLLDAGRGCLVVAPSPASLAAFDEKREAERALEASAERLLDLPARTASGRRIQTLLNVDRPEVLEDRLLEAGDGVGLWRTEFLFLDRDLLPDEEEQLAAYDALLARAGEKPVVVRTLDVGGDKALPGVSLSRETNPFLGLRGLRLCLERPTLFRPQLRALLRAATVHDNLRIMLPMVTRASEVEEARAVIRSCLLELAREGKAASQPPLGMMVETPASAIALDSFEVDFVSIGSNDLTQYVMAASRDEGGRVAELLDPLDPAVLGLIEGVIAHGRRSGLSVSLCGDMAATAEGAKALLDLGLERLSVGPAALARLKQRIACHGR